MTILKEIYISMFKPHEYYKFKEQTLPHLLAFLVLVLFVSEIFKTLYLFGFSLITGNFPAVYQLFLSGLTWTYALGLLYSYVGLVASIIVFVILFKGVDLIKEYKHVKIGTQIIYAVHMSLISAILSNVFSFFVIFFIAGYYIMAVKGELMLKANNNEKINPLNLLR